MLGSAIGTYSIKMAHQYGLNAAILYTEIFQRTRCPEPNREPDKEGYIPITAAEFQEWTTLTRRQQDRAFSILVKNGLIACDIKGMPARKYYKVLHTEAEND